MKILILSQHPWRKDNSFGNSYSNIFGRIKNIEIAHIYLADGIPDFEPVVTQYYQIPEKELFYKSLHFWKKSKGVGHVVKLDETKQKNDSPVVERNHKSLYGSFLGVGKRHHWSILYLVRELAWKYGKINYPDLMSFVYDFKPDIFFIPFSNLYFTNRLALYIKKHYHMPMVAYMAMDHYTLKRISFNPVFWLDRFGKRRIMRKVARQTELVFTISKKLKIELEESLHVRCEVLYKRPDTERGKMPYSPHDSELRFLFTGNILSNRWKSLAQLAEVLQKNRIGTLDIYTANPISKKISKALNIEGVSCIHKPVSQEEVINLQNAADVLVHAEGFDPYNKSLVRCAISTKIMDYLSVGRCILAIGPKDISSIEYFQENDLALVASSKQELEDIVIQISKDRTIVDSYSRKGLDYVINNLNSEKLNSEFYSLLDEIVNNYK